MFKIASYILGAGFVIGATAASAGDLPPDMADRVMNSCRPDYHRLCSFVVPGNGRAARCLLDHETELAPDCLTAIKIAFAIEACLPDYRRYCEGVPRGPEGFNCLASRGRALLPECRKVVSANVPYMDPRGGHYAYNQGETPYPYYREPAPYGDGRGPAPYAGDRGPVPYGYGPGPAPYGSDRGPAPAPYADGRGPAPYGEGGPGPYAYRGGPSGEEPYAEENGPGGPNSEGYPYDGRPGDQDRYANEQPPRMMPYGYRGPGYDAPGYGGQDRQPGEPGGPAQDEER